MRSPSGTAVSANLRRSTGSPAWMIASISCVLPRTLTFIPATHAILEQPERDELASGAIAAEDHPVPGARQTRVLHPDVVLIGEEVRQPVIDVIAPSIARAATGPWCSALAQCSTRTRSP